MATQWYDDEGMPPKIMNLGWEDVKIRGGINNQVSMPHATLLSQGNQK